MKALLLILASALLAVKLAAQPHIVGISPPFGDPFFGTNVYVFAEQLANKSATIEGAPAPNFQSSYTLAFYSCYHERQTVVATAPFNSAFQYFRARNDPCNGVAGVPQEIVDSRLCVPCNGVLWQLYEIVTAVPHRDGGARRFVAEPLWQL